MRFGNVLPAWEESVKAFMVTLSVMALPVLQFAFLIQAAGILQQMIFWVAAAFAPRPLQ